MEQRIVHWYAARVKYRTEKKIKNFLEEKEIGHFIPFRTIFREQKGKRVQKEKPVISCVIFVKTDYMTALSIPDKLGLSVSYIYNNDTKKFQVIPEKQMQDFMFLLDFTESSVIKISNTNLKRGDRVRVIKGDFAGIEGELVRTRGHKRVVVRLEGLFSLATTYIPNEYLEKI
ncbi:MAG: UpxY family transcription antiterminator [Prevotellaceae bacterium]|jgi:transcription antitermination factor NusG|nr:UpxY family transcription antiterminator [Prevotellaceae bacterium]